MNNKLNSQQRGVKIMNNTKNKKINEMGNCVKY